MERTAFLPVFIMLFSDKSFFPSFSRIFSYENIMNKRRKISLATSRLSVACPMSHGICAGAHEFYAIASFRVFFKHITFVMQPCINKMMHSGIHSYLMRGKTGPFSSFSPTFILRNSYIFLMFFAEYYNESKKRNVVFSTSACQFAE